MRLILVVLALALAAPATALPLGLPTDPACDPADDAGRGVDASESEPIVLGEGSYQGCIDREDADHTEAFLVTTGPGERLAATFSWSGSCFVYLSIYRMLDDGTREHERGLGGTICGPYTIHSDLDFPATYLLRFEMQSPSSRGTPYGLVVEVGPDVVGSCGPQDDAGSGRDAPRRASAPLGTGAGCVDEKDWEDVYAFSLAEPSRVILELESSDPCWVVEGFIMPRGSLNFWEEGWYYDAWDCERRTWGFELPAGEYDVVHAPIMIDHPTSIRYDLDVRPVEFGMCGPQDDAGSGRDSDADDRVVIGLAETYEACLDEFDHRDVLAFDVVEGDTFKVRIASADGGCNVPFLAARPEGAEPTWSSKSGCGYTYAYRASATGRWNLWLYGDGTFSDDLGPYTVRIDLCGWSGGVMTLLPPAEACNTGGTLAETWRSVNDGLGAKLPVSRLNAPR